MKAHDIEHSTDLDKSKENEISKDMYIREQTKEWTNKELDQLIEFIKNYRNCV